MVKCVDCGFLTLRDRATGLLVEVDDDYRVSGRVPPLVAYHAYHNYPICFTMAHNLMPEIEQAAQQQGEDGSDDWGKYVLGVITRERDCVATGKTLGFTEYQQGFTPKEHREMLDRQWQLEYEAKRDKEDKEWRESQETKAEGRHQQQLGVLKQLHKREMWIVGGAVTVAILIITMIGAAIEAEWFAPFFGLFD